MCQSAELIVIFPSAFDPFVIREYHILGMILKPQDVVVLLKLVSLDDRHFAYAPLSKALHMSASEVHAAVTRAATAQLYSPASRTPMRRNLEEFLLHGVRYCFPAQWGTKTRGMPTAYAANPLRERIVSGDGLPPVWEYQHGTVEGLSVTPLYRSVPQAASDDSRLYDLLSLVDALRIGRARERRLAGDLLSARLRQPAVSV